MKTGQKSLTELANASGSDKGTVGPSAVHGGHNYTDIYEAYVGHLRDEPVNILEVGIGLKRKDDARIAHGRNAEGGGSIKMWHEYFTQGHIYAADIVDGSFLNNDRIHTYVVDQSNEASLRAFAKKLGDVRFDMVIDDGSHHPDHQQKTVGVLFPLLKSGGIFVIEDLQTNGFGDPVKNALGTYTDRAIHTRKVFKDFAQTGTFPSPNTILDAQVLTDRIASVHFHVPLTHINRFAALGRLWGGRDKVLEYQLDSELLCVLRAK